MPYPSGGRFDETMQRGARSLVLLPYGLPDGEDDRELVTALLLRAGGDLDRLIDQPAGDLERFSTHIARIPMLRDGVRGPPPVVLFSRTSPLPLTVVVARRKMEASVPSLATARWVLFVSPTDDPFFQEGAGRLGLLSGELADLPIWFGPERAPYLVVTPASDFEQLEERLAQLDGFIEKLRRRSSSEMAAVGGTSKGR